MLQTLVGAVLDGHPWEGRADLVPLFDPTQTYTLGDLVALPQRDPQELGPDTWVVAEVVEVEEGQNPLQGTFQVVTLRLGDKKRLLAAGIPSAQALPLRFPPDGPEDWEWLVSHFADDHHDTLASLVQEAARTGALPLIIQGDHVLRRDELVPLAGRWKASLERCFDALTSQGSIFATLDDLLAGLRSEGWAEGTPDDVAR
ncbi:MAG: hypothetical protein H5T59_13650, partial [Anaerolineae bacterium]|nr:hypothetical protein [Anaerolineae bacterium]